MKKRIIAMVTFLVLMFAFCSVALAAAGTQLYDASSINHQYDFGPLAKGTAPKWLSARDNNTYVQFVNTSVRQYRGCCVVTDNGTKMSNDSSADTGVPISFTLKPAYQTVAHANLRVKNPYYGTSNASTMSVYGNFTMTF